MAKPSSTDDRAQIQVIARAAAILRSLEDAERGLSLGQIAGRVDLPRSTVQRIVAALEAETLLISASPAGGVRLGPGLLRLAASVNTAVSVIARPLIVDLSAELKETVDISAPKRDHAIFIDQVVGSQRLRTVSRVGETFPLYCTANGKSFLARLSDDEVIRLVGSTYEARTPRTHQTFEALREDLQQIRAQGYAIDAEEHTQGISAAGVLLYDSFGSPLMVSVPVPSARFESRRTGIVEKLLTMKQKLQDRFGAAA